jgi:hypothetical protein
MYQTIYLRFGSDQTYSVEISLVRSETYKTILSLLNFKSVLENYLKNVVINPESTFELHRTHIYLWEKINQMSITFPKIYVDGYFGTEAYPTPPYVSFEEYLYAEQRKSRVCKKLVEEYDDVISTSTFAHLFDYREVIKYLLNEAELIYQSLYVDFGEKYEDESQEQVAAHYFYWCKMAIHYQELFTKNLSSPPTGLPEAEVDKTTKKQAMQFQGIFSIKVDSFTTLIDSQLDSLRADLVTNGTVFYRKFLGPAIKLKSKIISDFSVDLRTSRMRSELPTLSAEAVSAMLIAEGNFKSLMTDLIERRNSTTQKIDDIYEKILQRRKYINYISQLENRGVKKINVFSQKNDSVYETLLSSLQYDDSSDDMKSSHDFLDDLGQDSHPQYLMKSGRNFDWSDST